MSLPFVTSNDLFGDLSGPEARTVASRSLDRHYRKDATLFVEGDPSFCALYSADDRETLRSALESVFKVLIDREMREHARRFSTGVR